MLAKCGGRGRSARAGDAARGRQAVAADERAKSPPLRLLPSTTSPLLPPPFPYPSPSPNLLPFKMSSDLCVLLLPGSLELLSGGELERNAARLGALGRRWGERQWQAGKEALPQPLRPTRPCLPSPPSLLPPCPAVPRYQSPRLTACCLALFLSSADIGLIGLAVMVRRCSFRPAELRKPPPYVRPTDSPPPSSSLAVL